MIILEYYKRVNEYLVGLNPLAKHYFLVKSPLNIMWITLAYMYFVKKLGPKLMEDRKPFELRKAMLAYNLLQVISNSYVFYRATHMVMTNPLYADWSCMRYDFNTTDRFAMDSAYMYLLLKLLDYVDTIFMVLRKKYNQITFLHFYHHILMVFSVTAIMLIAGVSHTAMTGFANAFIHIIMYFYYFLSALSSRVKESLWWKKYLTILQIVQFIFLAIHFIRAIMNPNCDQNRTILYFSFVQDIVMLILFCNFYRKAYIQPKKNSKSKTH